MQRRHLPLLALPFLARPALAWAPDRPIRLVAPFGAGGPSDVVARLLAEELGTLLGFSFIVENRAGGGGSVAAEYVARSRPDGTTLMLASQATHGVSPVVNRLNLDPGTETLPIANVAGVPAVLVVAPATPAATLAEFIALAKSRPGALSYGSAGVGTSTHMTLALLAHRAGLDMLHVPFRTTAQVYPEILGGRITAMTDAINTALPFIREGRVKALGVSTPQRLPILPDVPAIAEALPGYEVLNWYGINGPNNTPAEAVTTLHEGMQRLLAKPEFQARIAAQGLVALPMSTAEYVRYIAADRAQWAALVAATGIKPE